MPNSSNLLRKTINFSINLVKIIFTPVVAAICFADYLYESEREDYIRQINSINNNPSNTKVELSRLDKFKCLSKSIKPTLHASFNIVFVSIIVLLSIAWDALLFIPSIVAFLFAMSTDSLGSGYTKTESLGEKRNFTLEECKSSEENFKNREQNSTKVCSLGINS